MQMMETSEGVRKRCMVEQLLSRDESESIKMLKCLFGSRTKVVRESLMGIG